MCFYPDRYPFTSSHLKRLHLRLIAVTNCFIKQLFSGCPALEDLEMRSCDITATEFSSSTLKNLSIDCVGYCSKQYVDIVIDMPSLVSLCIGALSGTKPYFTNMRSLLSASIFIEEYWSKYSVGCYILPAFSNVKNLKLLSSNGMVGEEFLGNDKLFCQVEFTNLTTLSLGDWCLHHRCQALLYVLKHSPNLEKVTLMLCDSEVLPLTYEQCSNVTPFSCKKLQKIEIICSKQFNHNIGVVVAILCDNLISLPEINIKPS